MNRLISTLLFASWATIVIAQPTTERPPVDIKGAELVWAGVYEGVEDWFKHPTLLENTDRIPAKVGLKFGMYFIIHSEPAAGILTVRYRTTVPPAGLPEGSGGRRQPAESRIQCILGKPCLAGVRFESEDEIVAGRWVLEIFYRDAKVIEHVFEIEPATSSKRTEIVCQLTEPDCANLSTAPNPSIQRERAGSGVPLLASKRLAADFER